jgi:hypothetical protein
MNPSPKQVDHPKRRPLSDRDPTGDPTRCGHHGGRRSDGKPCGSLVIAGTKSCRMHAGIPAAKARAKGAVVVELHRWGLDGHTTLRDAGEVMLRLVTQSAARVELYSRLLEQAFDAAERLRQAHDAEGLDLVDDDSPADEDDEMGESPAVQRAREDLRRVFATGGVGALIGYRYDADRHGRVYAVDEGIRGLAKLEADERDRCANFATKAIAAGLAERQVRLAEQQGALVAGAVRAILGDLGLTAEQQALVADVVPRRLRELAGGSA